LRSVESFGSAAEAIGPVERGMSLFAVTRGQWSMIDALQYVLDAIGGGHVSVWTWAIADYEVETLQGLMWRRDLASARLIVDMSADRRNPAILRQWRTTFGDDSVRVCRNHAKIARVWNDDLRLLLRGSMNLNFNPRFEQFDMTEGGADYDLVREIEEGLPVLPKRYTFQDVAAATKINMAFPPETLAAFGELAALGDFANVQSLKSVNDE
jgi:hypothetical protein